MGGAEHVRDLARDVGIGQDPGAHGVVDVVVDIGDLVGLADDLPLKRLRQTAVAAMAKDAHAHLIGQVQPLPVLFEDVHHTQRLLVVAEGPARHLAERDLPGMAEGRVPQIVAEGDRLGQILVQPQGARDRPRDARDLERVRHAGAVVVALRLQKDLRLVHQTAEGFAVQDAVGIALITGAHIILRRRLGAGSALGLVGKLRFFAQKLMLAPFKLFADRHEDRPSV